MPPRTKKYTASDIVPSITATPLTREEAQLANRPLYGPPELQDFPPFRGYVTRDTPPRNMPGYTLDSEGCPIIVKEEVFCRAFWADGTMCGYRAQRADLIGHLKKKHGVPKDGEFKVRHVKGWEVYYMIFYAAIMEGEEYEGKVALVKEDGELKVEEAEPGQVLADFDFDFEEAMPEPTEAESDSTEATLRSAAQNEAAALYRGLAGEEREAAFLRELDENIRLAAEEAAARDAQSTSSPWIIENIRPDARTIRPYDTLLDIPDLYSVWEVPSQIVVLRIPSRRGRAALRLL